MGRPKDAAILLCFILATGLSLAPRAQAVENTSVIASKAEFAIQAAPQTADWRYFHATSAESRAALWNQYAKQGKQLKDWSWGWRLGWMQACTADKNPQCPQLLKQGLKDKAMVVRAEAATSIGKRFEDSHSNGAIAQLKQAFQNKLNGRHGRPLYVQQRILYALKQIGGNAAAEAGSALVEDDPVSKLYWQRLNKF